MGELAQRVRERRESERDRNSDGKRDPISILYYFTLSDLGRPPWASKLSIAVSFVGIDFVLIVCSLNV